MNNLIGPTQFKRSTETKLLHQTATQLSRPEWSVYQFYLLKFSLNQEVFEAIALPADDGTDFLADGNRQKSTDTQVCHLEAKFGWLEHLFA